MKTPEQIDEEFECQKCHALVQLGDGLIPTKYCNLCAQELVESMSDRLKAVEAESKSRRKEIASLDEQLAEAKRAIETQYNLRQAAEAERDLLLDELRNERSKVEAQDCEIGKFQDEVRDLVIKLSGAPDESIDGKGSDADWQEFTLAEISQGFTYLLDRLQAVEAERDRYRAALIKGCDSGCDARPDSKSYYCADCQQSITVCSDCHEILIGCDCGLCNIGAFFNEQD